MIFKELREFFLYMELSEFKNSLYFKSYIQKLSQKHQNNRKVVILQK